MLGGGLEYLIDRGELLKAKQLSRESKKNEEILRDQLALALAQLGKQVQLNRTLEQKRDGKQGLRCAIRLLRDC